MNLLNSCKKKLENVYGNIVINDFTILEWKGEGSFGSVYKAKFKKTNKIYAIKSIPIEKIKSNFLENQIKNEIEIMENISHKNVIEMYYYFEDNENIYIVLDYCEGGHLFNKLLENGCFDEEKSCKIILEVLQALQYLHSRNPKIIHRDIKLENLLIKEGTIKWTDFGWSNFKNDVRNTYCGTPEYLSPEMIKEIPHNEKLDIWCLGIILFELINLKPPFSPKIDCTSKYQYQNILKKNILEKDPIFEGDLTKECKEILNLMLQKNFEDRPSAESLLNHQWFKILENNKIMNENIFNIKNDFSIIFSNFSKGNFKKVNASKNFVSREIYQENNYLETENTVKREYNNVRFDDIKGLEYVKQESLTIVEWENNLDEERNSILNNVKNSLISEKSNHIIEKWNEWDKIKEENITIKNSNIKLKKNYEALESNIEELTMDKVKMEKYKLKNKRLKTKINNLKEENNKLKLEIKNYKISNEYNTEKINDINNILNETDMKKNFNTINNSILSINKIMNEIINNSYIEKENINNNNIEFNEKIIDNINNNFKKLNFNNLNKNNTNNDNLKLYKQIEELEKNDIFKNKKINELKLKLVEMEYHIQNNKNLFNKVNNLENFINNLEEKIQIKNNDLKIYEGLVIKLKEKIENKNLEKNIKKNKL